MPSPDKFLETLQEADISADIICEINDGYADISCKSPKKIKAAYFRQAIACMEQRLPQAVMQEILERNACCKSGAREKAAKAFARENAACSLAEKLEKIENVPYMGRPVLNDDGSITVHAISFYDGERFACVCPSYSKLNRDYAVSRSYCFCCAGHFRHHYQIMLGIPLRTAEIVSSPLDSNGEQPCVIRFVQEPA